MNEWVLVGIGALVSLVLVGGGGFLVNAIKGKSKDAPKA